MTTGIKLTDEVVKAFDQFKPGKTNRARYVLFKVSSDLTVIEKVAEQEYKPFDFDSGDDEAKKSYQEFVEKAFDEKQPIYAVYDYEYSYENSVRSKIVFITWVPQKTPIKLRFIYPGSKSSFSAIQAVNISMEATDLSEVDYDKVLERCLKLSN